MAFKNLEQRFNEKVNQLYAAATSKFENGRPSTGRNDDPLIVRKPGQRYFTALDRIGGRSLPINSTVQDVKRLTLFTFSVRGVAFLAKQQLLQTGNTFEQTRLINPTFILANGVPFLHVRRHLRPITGGPGGALLKKTDTSYANVRKLGQLQSGTYKDLTETSTGGVGKFFKKLAGPITSTISAFTAKKNVGEQFGNWDETSWKQSRPELGKSDKDYIVAYSAPRFKFGGSITTDYFDGNKYGALSKSPGTWDGTYTTYINITNGSKPWSAGIFLRRRRVPFGMPFTETSTETRGDPVISEEVNSLAKQYNDFKFEDETTIPNNLKNIRSDYQQTKQDWYESDLGGRGEGIMPYLKYFTGDNESITDGRQYDPDSNEGANAKYLAEDRTDKSRKISYIKDPSNIEIDTNTIQSAYKYINGARDAFEDAITVSFAMGNNESIKFRAFITNLNESATPTYNTLQYIGRVEKFINYTGVQREVSFKLAILAFSKEELSGVWRRINYLTGMVFPYAFTKGLLQPNVIRLTIGNVYVDQPGYISSLSKNFTELTETWDLDQEVPIGATLDIKFTIIEKATRVADSPFHGITENLKGFNQAADIAKALGSLDIKDAPIVSPQKVSVEARVPTISPDGLQNLVNKSPLNVNTPGPLVVNLSPLSLTG